MKSLFVFRAGTAVVGVKQDGNVLPAAAATVRFRSPTGR